MVKTLSRATGINSVFKTETSLLSAFTAIMPDCTKNKIMALVTTITIKNTNLSVITLALVFMRFGIALCLRKNIIVHSLFLIWQSRTYTLLFFQIVIFL